MERFISGFRDDNGEEKHNFSLDWLVENGGTISQMIGNCPIMLPILFAIHTTVTDLKENTLRR